MSLASLVDAWLRRPEVGRALATFVLVSARLSPLALLAPWLGLRSAPTLVRSVVVVGLAIALTPLASESAPATLPGAAALSLHLVREALIGTLFALVSGAPFLALETGGRLVDLHRGANLAEVIAPPTGERTSPLGDLALLGGLALFASVGGVRLAFEAFAETLVDLPVGGVPFGTRAVYLEAAHAMTDALRFAATIAAPAAIAVVAADVGLGLVARTVPRISVFFVGMPLRATLGLVVAFASIGIALRVAVEHAAQGIALASRLAR